MTFSSKNRGYTLLFATLTAAVVLGVAIFISTVARKQYILASTARDSMFAIYNADSALECAAGAVLNLGNGDDRFVCNNAAYQIAFTGDVLTTGVPIGWSNNDTFESEPIKIFFYDNPSDPINTSRGCAVVTVLINIDVNSNIVKQQVNSRGYNLGKGTECPTVGPRTVERAMRVTYE